MPTIKSPDLQVNKAIEAAAPDATLTIEIDPAKRLRVGAYVFQLQVMDDAKNLSAPDTITLRIVDDTNPTAVITGPPTVSFGKSFALSGARSFDADDGKIVRYVWTLLSVPGPGPNPNPPA